MACLLRRNKFLVIVMHKKYKNGKSFYQTDETRNKKSRIVEGIHRERQD